MKLIYKENYIKIYSSSLLIAICSIAFSYLFIENFIFSKNFHLLLFREVDDLAYQSTLRIYHDEMLKLHFDKLFRAFDYGYGWIFWFPIIIITFPLFLLSKFCAIDWPLIVLPRELSLFLSFATVYVIYKTLKIYIKNEWIVFNAILLFLSFPTFGYFSIRFGTQAQIMFFSSLAFYLVSRKEILEKKDLKYIAISLAAACGTKISGFLTSPLIALMLANKFNWKINKENIIKAAYFGGIFILFFAIFSLPSLLASPFKPSILYNYIDAIRFFLQFKETNHFGTQSTFLENFLSGIIKNNVNIFVFFIIIAAFLIKIIENFCNKQKKDLLNYLVFFFALLIVITYLVFNVNIGSSYVSSYFTAISFVGLLAFSAFDNKKFGVLIASFLVIANIALHKNMIFTSGNEKTVYSYNLFYVKAMDSKILNQIRIQKELQNLISLKDLPKIRILQDIEAPTIYSNLANSKKNIYTEYISGGNIAESINDQDRFDYILLSTEINRSDKKNIELLFEDKIFKNDAYSIIYQSGDLTLFQANSIDRVR